MFAGLHSIQSPWARDTTFGGIHGNTFIKYIATSLELLSEDEVELASAALG